jgi:hypothetical protein
MNAGMNPEVTRRAFIIGHADRTSIGPCFGKE